MGTLADFRRQHPQYDDMSDTELAEALHKKYYSDLPKEQVFKQLAVEPQAAAAPATPVVPEEESTLSALGRAVERNVPSFRKNVARIVEEAPEIAGSIFAGLPGTNYLAPLAKGLGAAAAQSETYKDLTGEMVASERAAAEKKLAEIGPRKYGSVFEEEGLGRKLGSLAETVAESALPVGAGVATGLVTRNPMAAGIVMGAGNIPATYGGIRERQEAEGIRNIDQALLGTAASSALDMLTGVGGKVLSGTAAIAAKELLEAGLKQAAMRVVKSGGEEAVTESLQNVIEQVAGGTDPLTKKAMLETLEAGLAGALGGTVFTGATEVAAAPFRPKVGAETTPSVDLENSPEVQQEYLRLVTEQAQALRDQDSSLTQRQAFSQVVKNAGDLYDTAIENVLNGTQGGANVAPDVGTGVDVVEGTGAGVAPDLGPAPTAVSAPELGEAVAGGLGEPVPSVPVSDVGEGAGVGTLEATPEVAAPTPAPVFDITPITEASTRKDRVSAAKQVAAAIVSATPELQELPAATYGKAVNQMATAASRGEQFDPVDVLYNAAEIERPAPTEEAVPTVAETATAAPTVAETTTPEPPSIMPPEEAPAGVAPEVIEAELEPVEGKPDFYRNPLPNDVDEWTALHVGKTQKENQALVKRRREAEAGATELDIPITDLVGIEAEVGKRALQAPSKELPYVEYANGKYFVVDGNHRVVASYLNGAQTVRARVGNLEAPGVVPAIPSTTTPTPEAAAPPGVPPAPATPAAAAPAPKQPKVVSKGKPVKLTPAQTRMAIEKAVVTRTKMNRIQKRIASTNKTSDVVSGQIELGKLVRGDKDNLALLRGAVDTLNVAKWRTILPALSTDDIFRIIKDRIPGLKEADNIVRQQVTRFQTKEYLRLSDQLDQIAAFLKKFPKAAQALSDLQFATVAFQVDPTKANSAEEYAAKFDKKTAELRTKLAAEKDTKKKAALKRRISRRFNEIESVYKGVPGGDERVHGWRDMNRPELGGGKGKEIFTLIRDAHRRDLEASYEGLRSRLMETKEGDALDEALEKLEEQFKPALDQTIYFPAMRFGSYYARVGKGANSIFKMFETETKRNQFVRLMEQRGEDVTETGNVDDLRNQFEKVTGSPLKDVLDLFDDNPKDIGALKGQVFDLWLQSLSSGDMRKHMAPRQMRAGYSTDILKNFANFRRSSINNQKRSQFGYKLRTEISRAKDSLEGAPDREKMKTFVNEIELRTLSDLMPPSAENSVWEQAVALGNKMAFYQYLANPKTAAIQLTQLHIVALPMLAQKYGSAKATAALGKYGFSSLGGLVTSPLKAFKRQDGSFTFDWEQPNLLDNPISTLKKESDPKLYEVLSDGWNEGRDLNLYMDTFANDIGNYGNLDPSQRTALQELMAGRPITATLRGATFTFEAMGALMHQMERVNREATYMAALELGYRENLKKGQSHAEAKANAIEDAVNMTLEATFDFSSYNKPRLLTTTGGRLAGQFMTYPYMMASLMARNMYTAIKFGELEPGERMAAAQIATGTMVNIGLYAGLTGLPLYGLFKVLGSLLASMFDDDDEEGGLSYIDADGNIKATYDIDWWFRNVWIPKFFGPDGTVANLFGLDAGTAEVLARSVEKGPISAITDVDVSNSVALDFMFFLPKESRADTPEGKLMETTFNTVTGAMGGTLMDYIKAGKDLSNGYTDRALEKLPKLYGNMFKADRFAEEGQLNYSRELVGMDKDFWTSDKAILQGLGFASTEADQRQQQNYDAKSISVKVKTEREDMLNRFRKVALDTYQYGYTPSVEAERQKVMEDWVKFNETYPTDVIGLDTLYEVQNNAIQNALRSQATRGVPLDEKGKTPYLRDILKRRVESEEK